MPTPQGIRTQLSNPKKNNSTPTSKTNPGTTEAPANDDNNNSNNNNSPIEFDTVSFLFRIIKKSIKPKLLSNNYVKYLTKKVYGESVCDPENKLEINYVYNRANLSL